MTNKIILSSIVSLSLTTLIEAKNLLQDIECGQVLNTNNFISKDINIEKNCRVIPIKQQVIYKIIQIKSYKELFDALGSPYPYRLYHDKNYYKILNDFYINDYTLSYLFYKKVTNFKNILEEIDENNTTASLIKNIQLGGEYIGLIHIKTVDQNDYNTLKKKISKKFLNITHIDTLEEKFIQISKNHEIIIKEYMTDHKNITRSSNLKEFFQNFKIYQEKIRGENQPMSFELLKEKEKSTDLLLNQMYQKNNLYYINTHPNEFFIKNRKEYIKAYHNIEEKVLQIEKSNLQDENLTFSLLDLPKRYKHSINIPPIQTKPFNFTMKEENILQQYPRIDENITFTFILQLQLDIKRAGKVIIQTIDAKLLDGDKLIAKEKNSQIKLDTFVNYPKLKFHKIKNYSFGTISFKMQFNTYEQEKEIAGNGLIETAQCGYKITNDHKLQFQCKEIQLKPLQIEFLHDE